MTKKIIVPFLATLVLALVSLAQAQTKIYRIGVILEGGPYNLAVDGLKDGLKELGFAEGQQYVMEIRDLKGNRKAAEAAARGLEGQKVDLIYTLATSVTTEVKGATTEVPIVFALGNDPVAAGLVESFARPGGRLTGVYRQDTEVDSKRLEILRAILPDLHRVVMFYDPDNVIAMRTTKSVREAARQLHVEVVERHVASVEELRLGIQGLQPRDVDAFLHSDDAMVISQAQFIIDVARTKRLPTMFSYPELAAQGALVSYGVSYREVGRASAKYVHRVLTGTRPQDLPVELLSKVELAINLKTAREIGVTIAQEVRLRADKIFE
jgi:putative ABC transport system substrate-binding protein